MSAATPLDPALFRSNGFIRKRVRDDGMVWCADCRAFRPPDAFYRNANNAGGYASYCKAHKALRQARAELTNPAIYKRMRARQNRWMREHIYAVKTAERMESRDLAAHAVEWLKTRGLFVPEIAELCGLCRTTIWNLRRPTRRGPDRHVCERVLALFRAASDLPALDRVPYPYYPPHPAMETLRRRMREPLAAIETGSRRGHANHVPKQETRRKLARRTT